MYVSPLLGIGTFSVRCVRTTEINLGFCFRVATIPLRMPLLAHILRLAISWASSARLGWPSSKPVTQFTRRVKVALERMSRRAKTGLPSDFSCTFAFWFGILRSCSFMYTLASCSIHHICTVLREVCELCFVSHKSVLARATDCKRFLCCFALKDCEVLL